MSTQVFLVGYNCLYYEICKDECFAKELLLQFSFAHEVLNRQLLPSDASCPEVHPVVSGSDTPLRLLVACDYYRTGLSLVTRR